MSSRLRTWKAPLLLAGSSTLLTLALLAGVGEWAVRYRERTRTTVPGTMSMLFYRHKRLMHGLVRGSDYYGWVHVGRQGFRGVRDVSLAPPPNTFRIITVGGSTTFDANTSGDSCSWPARLEQILNKSGAPLHFEVLNAGVPGFQVFDDLVRLESELYRYRPDLIVLYQGHNDLFNTLSNAAEPISQAFEARPEEIQSIYPWQAWLERHSLLYHKLLSKVEAISFHSSGAQRATALTAAQYNRALDAGSENFGRSVREYLAIAKTLKTTVIIPEVVFAAKASLHPPSRADLRLLTLWAGATPFAPLSVVRSGYARYDSTARVAASDFGAVYVPATDSTLWTLDSYADGDPIHFNDRGSVSFARQLADVIRQLPTVDVRRRSAAIN